MWYIKNIKISERQPAPKTHKPTDPNELAQKSRRDNVFGVKGF